MGILLRFIIRNIREKKLRSILIVAAVTLSSALYFGTTGMSTTMQGMYLNRIRQYYGSADIMVFPSGRGESSFYPRIPPELSTEIEYAVGSIYSGAQVRLGEEIVQVTVLGIDYSEMQMMNPVTLAESKGLEPFFGKTSIIGKHTALQYGLSVGDYLRLEIQGGNYRFRVAGIAESSGFFADDGRNNRVIVPRNTLASIHGFRGRVSMMYVKARIPEESEQLLRQMQTEMNRYHVQETVSRREIEQWANETTVPFRIMLVATLAMSVFIIFTCFQVIAMERLPVVGTFRSIGATRRSTNFILLAEGSLYGVIGGILGCGLGFGVIYLMTLLNTEGWLSQTGIALQFTPRQLLQTFLLAVAISIGSALIPIIRISRLPIKDVILSTVKSSESHPWIRGSIGIVFLAGGIGTSFFIPVSFAVVLVSVCLLLILVAVVLLVPLITKGFTPALRRVYKFLFGNIGVLAARNVSVNRSMLHNIALLAIGISSLYIINTISSSVAASLTNMYRDAQFDIQVWVWPSDRRLLTQLRTVPGVSETFGLYGVRDVRLPDYNDSINFINGVEKNTYGQIWDIQTTGERELLFAKLNSNRYIILTYTLQRQLNLEVGDKLLLDFGRRKKHYEVAGFFNSVREYGSYALVGERFLKLDQGLKNFSDIYVKVSGQVDEVVANILEKFSRRYPWIITKNEMEDRDIRSNQGIMVVMKGFSLMTLCIGIVGVLNNYLLSFLERRRSLALLRSVGMSNRQNITMLLLEALSGGLIGGLSGLAAGFVLLLLSPSLFAALRLPVIIVFSASIGFMLMAIGVGISIGASVFPALKSSKLSIIEAIRYE